MNGGLRLRCRARSLLGVLAAVGLAATPAIRSELPPTQGTTAVAVEVSAGSSDPLIAILPIWDRSARAAPVDRIQEELTVQLGFGGLSVLSQAVVRQFMRRHRMRFLGGINSGLARTLEAETGAQAVLITSVDLYQAQNPPKLGLTSRLVLIGEEPRIVWMTSAMRSGDESPGFLGLGLIDDWSVILDRVSRQLTGSLVESVGSTSPRRRGRPGSSRRFRPKVYFAAPEFPDVSRRSERIAVLPFVNDSTSRYAAEILTDQVIRHLVAAGADIIEPGVVRQVLLETRQIYSGGPSRPDTDILRIDLRADLALYGEIDRYLETGPGIPYPVVDFALRAIDTGTQQAVWASISHAKGDDGVFFFDAGSVPTAQDLSSRMVRALVARTPGSD